MHPDEWKAIDELVRAALELAPEDREGFLEQSCSDASQRARVEELIRGAEEDTDKILGRPAFERIAQEDLDKLAGTEDLTPARVGAYRVRSLIGRGGMGAVYLAERADDQYRREVAVKLLHPVLASEWAIRRFRTERQILATLEHPNIAQLLDGGATDGGQPFLVMEHVAGVHIDSYCRQQKLSTNQRIELFLDVCSAVHYAHSHLIVHRDLKPSNILVSDDGVPKLLDFGIAKLLDPEMFPENVEETRTGVRPMSLGYASPEQIRGQKITTASDIYSLGVLLYRLLTDRLPRRFDGTDPQAVERVLRTEPPLPSAAVLSPPPEPPSDMVLEPRSPSECRQLSRRLRGDLDRILLKTLNEEPAQRYRNVLELVDDLRRYLEGRPVRARRQSIAYRAGKLVRRNKVSSTAVAVALALLIGLLVSTAVQSRRVALERDRALKVADFMAGLFDAAGPGNRKGDEITARELLERGVERIGSELADQPDIQATLLHTVGRVYRDLGLPGAVELLEQALENREALADVEPADLVMNHRDLAQAYFEKSETEHAVEHLETAIAIAEDRLGGDHPALAESLLMLAEVCEWRGEVDRSISLGERGVEITARSLGEDHTDYATALIRLGNIYRNNGNLERAAELISMSVDINRRVVGPDHVSLAASLDNLGLIRREQGELNLAAEIMTESLAINERALDPSHIRIATSNHNLGLVHQERGDLKQAEAYLSRALEMKLAAASENSMTLAATLNAVGQLSYDRGDLDKAQEYWTRVLEICSASLGPQSQYVGMTVGRLAWIDVARGDFAEARSKVATALEIIEGSLGADHYRYARHLRTLARLQRVEGELESAEATARRSVEIVVEMLGKEHMDYFAATGELAKILIARGRTEEAQRVLNDVIGTLTGMAETQPMPILSEYLALAQGVLGDCHAAADRSDQASFSWNEVVRLANIDPEIDPSVHLRRARAAALLKLGRPEEARADLEFLRGNGWRDPELEALAR